VDKVVHCHCGFDARAEHEDELVAEVRRHASDVHGMTLTRDEALLLVFRAELAAASTTPRAMTPRTETEER
jgi:predicted small metal-binding protein